jgi:hypothetical protein
MAGRLRLPSVPEAAETQVVVCCLSLPFYKRQIYTLKTRIFNEGVTKVKITRQPVVIIGRYLHIQSFHF